MINLLRERLKTVLVCTSRPETIGAPHYMSEALASVRKNFENPAGGLPPKTIAQAVIAFRKTQTLPTFLDAKYVCFGAGQPVDDTNWRLMDNREMLQQLFDQVKSYKSTPRRLLKCYQGLLASYFSFPINHSGTSESSLENWGELRSFLGRELKTVLRMQSIHNWLKTLSDNENLLNENPCKKYGNFLANDDDSEFKQICGNLGVPSDSWLLEEAVMAQISAACSFNDIMFNERLDDLLGVISNRINTLLPERLVIKCLACLVIRYSECASRPEHLLLRNMTIDKVGNPWLNRVSWNAHVGNEDARRMVDGWLKRHLITDFFALLSEDGSADKRRLQYWLRFEPEIEDMWFVLGKYARENRSSDFKKIREMAKGRLLNLDGGGANNNAFIIKIRNKIVVEFGVKGNACYIFDHDSLPFNFDRKYQNYNVTELKSKAHGKQMIHNDGNQKWEENFDDYLCNQIGWRPDSQPYAARHSNSNSQLLNSSLVVNNQLNEGSTKQNRAKTYSEQAYQEVSHWADQYGYKIVDNRCRNGAFWVYATNDIFEVNKYLSGRGFSYKLNKGWYRE